MSQIKISGSRRSLRNATNDDIEGKEFTPRTSLGATCLAFAPFDEGAGTNVNIYGELCAFPSDVSTDALTTWTGNYATVNHNLKNLTGFAPALGHEDNQASNHVLYMVALKNGLPANYAAVFSDANEEQYLGLKNNGTESQLLVVDGLLPQGAAQSKIVPDKIDSVLAILLDADTNRIYYYVDGVITFTTPESQFLLTGINSLKLNDGAAGTALADLYGIALFHFNDFPQDWHSAVTWMGEEWKAGRKKVWPYWTRILIGPPPVRGSIVGVPVNTAPIAIDTSMNATVSATTAGRFRASDPENAPLSYTLVTNGTLGTATVTNASTGAFDYAAGAVEGLDTITFTASDGVLTSNTGTVEITVVPDVIIIEPNTPPVANNLTATTPVSTTITGFLAGSDADNDPLTYSIITNGLHGTATITNAVTGAYSYRAGANAGTDNITYKVNDGQVDSNTATFSVTVTPVAPPPPPPPVGSVSWNLDFTAGAAGGTFSRTGAASSTNLTLNTNSVASGVPRFAYPLADGINRGLWIQPAYVDVTQQFGTALTNADYWVSSRSLATGTVTATVAGGIADINGGTSAFRVTGTDQGISSQRMGLAHLFDANELGELEASEQTVAFGTGITQPSPGAILRGATNGGIFEVRSVTTASGSWGTNAAGTMSIKMHTGSLATTENVHALGDTVTMFTTTGAATAVANSAMLPVTAYALVKRTSASSWPWVSMRVVSELNTNHEVLFDFIRGTATKQKPASPIGEIHGYGMKYRKNGWFLIWITFNVRAASAAAQAKVQVGFGKPISYHLSSAATAGNRPVIEDYVYFCTGTTPTGAWGRVARDVNQGDTIIYFTETSGTINNGDNAVISAVVPGDKFATVVAETTPTITPSYSLMFKATAAGGAGNSLNMSAQTFDIQYIGTVRNHMPPMVPITNAVADTVPNHVWVKYDAGTTALQTPAAGDAITTAGAGGVLLNAPHDATNATDRFYGTWTGSASGMLHINKTSGTFIDNAAVQKSAQTFATVNGAEAASSYRVQYPEKLQFNVASGAYQLPAANFAQVIKFFNPCRNYEGHWKKSHAYTSAGAEITPSIGDFEFRRNASGTTGSTEPDWLVKDGGGAMAAGDTKTDGTVTWTAYNPPQFYLWSSGSVSLRKLRQSIRFYVDATNYIDWRINDGQLYYHQGTATTAVAATLIHGATVTGAFSGATATLLANPALTSTGAWTGAATGMLALRPLGGIFIPREPLQVGGVTFATALGVVQKSNGTFDEGDYRVGMKRTAANGTELWVNGFLRAQKSAGAAFSTTALPVGATWFLGSDTNGVNQAGMQYYGIELQTET